MPSHLKIPHDASVLVCDGRKGLLVRNEGNEVYPNLKVRDIVRATGNPRRREREIDRPGRVVTAGSQRTGVEQTDLHQAAEDAFAAEITEHLDILHGAAAPIKALVLVARPGMLTALRADLPKLLKALKPPRLDPERAAPSCGRGQRGQDEHFCRP